MAFEFSVIAPHGFVDPLHWDERDSTLIDQHLHLPEFYSFVFWLASIIEFALGHLVVNVT